MNYPFRTWVFLDDEEYFGVAVMDVEINERMYLSMHMRSESKLIYSNSWKEFLETNIAMIVDAVEDGDQDYD